MTTPTRGVYAIFTRHGWGDPETVWRGPFHSLTVTDCQALDSTRFPVATMDEPGWWVPAGEDPGISYSLTIAPRKPRIAS